MPTWCWWWFKTWGRSQANIKRSTFLKALPSSWVPRITNIHIKHVKEIDEKTFLTEVLCINVILANNYYLSYKDYVTILLFKYVSWNTRKTLFEIKKKRYNIGIWLNKSWRHGAWSTIILCTYVNKITWKTYIFHYIRNMQHIPHYCLLFTKW